MSGRRWLLLILLCVVEAWPLALVVALLRVWATQATAPPLSPISAVLSALGGYALAATWPREGRAAPFEKTASFVAALVVSPLLYAGWLLPGLPSLDPPSLALAAASVVAEIVAWRRGASVAWQFTGFRFFDDVHNRFLRGLAIAAVALILATVTPGAAPRDLVNATWPGLVLFFVAGLCAASLARAEEERQRAEEGQVARLQAGGAMSQPPEMVAAMFGGAGVLLLLGLLLTALVSPGMLAGLLSALTGFLGGLLGWLLSPFHAAHAPRQLPPGGNLVHRQVQPAGHTGSGLVATPGQLSFVLAIAVVVGLTILVVMAVLRAGRRPPERTAPSSPFPLLIALLVWALLLWPLIKLLSSLFTPVVAAAAPLLFPPASSSAGAVQGAAQPVSGGQDAPLIVPAIAFLWLLMLVALLAGLWYLLRLVRARPRRPRVAINAAKRSPGPARRPLHRQLVEWFRGLWLGLFRRRRRAGYTAEQQEPVHYAGEVEADPSTVREVYRRLLRRGAELGYARRPHETPLEYLDRLHGLPLPEHDADLLTALYARVRYGRGGERPEDIDSALTLWERLDRAVRRLASQKQT